MLADLLRLIGSPTYTVLSVMLAIAAIGHMLSSRRSSSSAMAWLLAIVILPIVAVPLYLVFSGRKMKKHQESKAALALSGLPEIPVDEATSIDRFFRRSGLPGATIQVRVCLVRHQNSLTRATSSLPQEIPL